MSKQEDKARVDLIIKNIEALVKEADKILDPYNLRLTDGGYGIEDGLFVAGQWDDSACWAEPDVWENSNVELEDEDDDVWESSDEWDDSGC